MIAISEKYHLVTLVVISVLVIQTVMSQRPPFAGSRPADGLNQKDKYHGNTVANGSADIANRFGSDSAPVISNPIPFGQTQKPPQGAIIFPESSFAPLQPVQPVRPQGSAASGDRVSFEDRFGETDSNVVGNGTASNTTSRPIHPLDAHGDQQLINQLSKLPQDKQPFWFVNYQAIEAQRNNSVANLAGAQASSGSFFG